MKPESREGAESAREAICPNCETATGRVGDPCPVEACRRKDYRQIPTGWYESSKAFAARRDRFLDPMLGRTVGRYLVAGNLGRGGMGAVYLALHAPLGREVALKLISGTDLGAEGVARFEREARAVAALDHPNIVRLYDYGVEDAHFRGPYMALEYIRHGRSLAAALDEVRVSTGEIAGGVVVTVFEQVLNALGAAHDRGIVHRDVKPENVMVVAVRGNAHLVKVLDFGLAKAVSGITGFDGPLSRSHELLGTPYYMAPEQVSEDRCAAVDARTDLYAVGVMLFEAFTGVMPFEGSSVLAVLSKKVDPAFRPLDLPEARALPGTLRRFLERGMAPQPDTRFQAATEMLEALKAALSAGATTAIGLAPHLHGLGSQAPVTPPTPGPRSASAAAASAVIASASAASPPPPVRARERPARTGRPGIAVAVVVAASVAAVVAAGVVLAVRGGGADERREADEGRLPAEASTAPPAAPPASASAAPAAPPAAPPMPPSAAPPAPTVTPAVRFRSEPAGARVYEGARLLGTTPFETSLDGPSGKREFVFRLDGHVDARVLAEPADGSTVMGRLDAERRPAAGPRGKTTRQPRTYKLVD